MARPRTLVRALAVIAIAVGLWATLIEPRRLVDHREVLALPRWPAALDGLKVAVVSDMHLGAWLVDESRLQQVVARTQALAPDLILLLGDFVAGHGPKPAPDLAALTRALAALHAPLGVYAVLGNHDWWVDADGVRRALTAAHIPVLDQHAVPLVHGGQRLWLVGVADPDSQIADPVRAMAEARAAAGEPVLCMMHHPDLFPMVPATASLTMAGHTHGGQVRLPFFGAPIVPSRYGQRYVAGHREEQGRHLFVTTGIGTSILPLRLGVPPEIALLTLSSSRPPSR